LLTYLPTFYLLNTTARKQHVYFALQLNVATVATSSQQFLLIFSRPN